MKLQIETPMDVGQELWFMNNNKPCLAIISEVVVTVTSYTQEGESWYRQLWDRWLNKKAMDVYTHSYRYSIKIDGDYTNHYLDTLNGKDPKVYGKAAFFTKEELLASFS